MVNEQPHTLERIADLLDQASRELRAYSQSSLASLAKPEPLHGVAMLTPNELAKLIQVHTRTLRRMRHEGKIPEPVYLNSRPRWRRADIDRWLEEPR